MKINKNKLHIHILEKDLESVKSFLLKHPDPKVRAAAESKYNQQIKAEYINKL